MIANTGDIQLSNPSIINSRLQSPTIPDGLYKNATVSFGHNLYPESIKAGIDMYGVRGTYTNDANAVASDILSGKTAYARGSKITGNISTYSGDRSISAPTISGNNLITPTISNGYYNNARLSFPKGNLSPENIKKELIYLVSLAQWIQGVFSVPCGQTFGILEGVKTRLYGIVLI